MVVGDDVAARRDEEARTERVALLIGFRRAFVFFFATFLFAELVFVFVEARQAAEGIEGAVAVSHLDLGGHLHADHGRADPLDQVGKAHRRAGRRRSRRSASAPSRAGSQRSDTHRDRSHQPAAKPTTASSKLHHSLSLTASACATSDANLDTEQVPATAKTCSARWSCDRAENPRTLTTVDDRLL